MKHVIRIIVIFLVLISFAFSSAFPKGIISFKNESKIKVKKVEVREDFVFYRYEGKDHSTMLKDVQWIKVRGKVQRVAGTITGGLGFLVVGGISAKVIQGRPEYAGKLVGITLGTTAVTYLGGRLVGGLLDPWRKIYTSPQNMNSE